ncbi:MAG TPA: AAA family ATPase [Rubrobacteraceae bacterium]|nr:AAA family ATPase [Rubrobacteraceae bacterium]
MLSAIYIKGFKTFARPVRMPLSGGVTAIVGPNGSGKSNITDAVLFALGEASPNLLRTGSMSDLIFSGSDSLPVAGAAEVTLVLDNANGHISLPYQEVSLTRRISRDGETEYRINGDRARLRDIRVVASEAGLGRHSILRQGAVDAIVAGGAAACRTALEEAVGLGIFRRRRLAATRKLERAAAQLESSRRLETELSAQLQRIEAEAAAAREYRELETRYRKLSLAYLYRVATRELDDSRERLADLGARVAALQTRQESLREEGRRLKTEEKKLEDRVRTTEQVLGGLEHGSEALRTEALRAERALLRLEGVRERKADRSRLSSRLEAELEETTSEVRRHEEKVNELEKEHLGKKEAFKHLEKLVEQRRAEHAAASGRYVRIEGELENLKERRERVVVRLEAGDDLLRDEELARFKEMEKELSTYAPKALRAYREEVLGRLEELRLLTTGKTEEADRRRGVLAALVGMTEAELKALRASSIQFGGKRLYEILCPRPGYEAAVEAALGDMAGGVLARTLDEGMRLLLEAPAERVVVRLDAQGVSKNGELPGKPLLDCVEVLDSSYTEALERLLDGIYVLEEPDWTGPNNGYVAVTRDGLRFTRTSASRLPVRGGDFARQARLVKVEERLDALKNRLGGELYDLREKLTVASRRLDGRVAEVEALGALDSRALKATQMLVVETGHWAKKAEAERERRAADEENARRTEAEIYTMQNDLREAQNTEEEAKKKVDTAYVAREAAYTASREAAEQLARTRAELHNARERRTRILHRLSGLKDTKTTDENACRTALARRAGHHARQVETAVRNRLARLRRSRSEATGLQGRVTNKQTELAVETGDVAEELARSSMQADALQKEVLSTEESRKVAEREIIDEWGATLEIAREAAQTFSDTAEAKRERARLARKLKAFGDVNLLAIGQEGQLRERHEFIVAQRHDAEAAAAKIERIIRDVDREIETRFEATFREVRRAFGAMVPRMMEGAIGELELSEEGVEIALKLRGRGWKPLGVLSGGERSLLALAFLFSIFLGRPGSAPRAFCMLDEAEAALDDLNLARFLAVVDSYRADGQFLLVTHQKRTMVAADVLYGVTPDFSGATVVVSKRLTGE